MFIRTKGSLMQRLLSHHQTQDIELSSQASLNVMRNQLVAQYICGSSLGSGQLHFTQLMALRCRGWQGVCLLPTYRIGQWAAAAPECPTAQEPEKNPIFLEHPNYRDTVVTLG